MDSDVQSGSHIFHFDRGPESAPPPTILILPGLNNSGPDHWQSHWEQLPGFRRLEFGAWAQPCRDQWVSRLDRALEEASQPVVLAAHSLGCIAVARWATSERAGRHLGKLAGALLVAPPDVEAPDADPRVAAFGPVPRDRLPFRSLLVASRNDHYCSHDQAAALAQGWGSDFVDLGHAGHINADSGLAEWSRGLTLLASLTGDNPNAWINELALKRAFV